MTQGEDRNTSFLKQLAHYFSATILSNAITIATLPFFTRHLSPADYGIVSLFIMFGAVTTTIITTGIHTATFRYFFQFKNDNEAFKKLNSTNFIFLLAIFGVGGVVVIFCADVISKSIFKSEISGQLIKLAFLSGCLEYLGNYFLFQFSALRKSLSYSIIIISKLGLNVGISVVLILQYSLTYQARIYGLLTSQLIIFVVVLILSWRSLCFCFSRKMLTMSIRFSYPQLPMSLIGVAGSTLDKTMLNGYKGLASVGYYDFAIKISSFVSLIWDALLRTWTPFFLENASIDTAESRKRIVKRCYEISCFVLFFALVVSTFAEEMIKVLATREFYPAMYVVPVYVYSYLMSLFAMISMNQLMHSGKMIYQMPSAILNMVLNIVLNIILIQRYGAIGAALAIVLSGFASDLLLLYFGQKAYRLPTNNIRFLSLFGIHVFFTLLLYPIMAAKIYFLTKLAIKVVLLMLFLVILIRLKYVSLNTLRSLALRTALGRRLQRV